MMGIKATTSSRDLPGMPVVGDYCSCDPERCCEITPTSKQIGCQQQFPTLNFTTISPGYLKKFH